MRPNLAARARIWRRVENHRREGPDLTFVACRDDGVLLGVGALRLLGEGHAELKSMHTAAEARGQGVGGAIVAHLVALAREQGCTRVSLEAGSMEAFAPARALYARHGFVASEPFGDYPGGPNSTFMTLALDGGDGPLPA